MPDLRSGDPATLPANDVPVIGQPTAALLSILAAAYLPGNYCRRHNHSPSHQIHSDDEQEVLVKPPRSTHWSNRSSHRQHGLSAFQMGGPPLAAAHQAQATDRVRQIGVVTYGVALVIMIGWLFWIGKPVLLPVITALISVYILLTAAKTMERFPILGALPLWARHLLVLITFAGALVLLFALIANNLVQVMTALVRYEANLDALVTRSAGLLGIEDEPTWSNLRRLTIDEIDVRSWIAPMLVSLQGLGRFLFLVVLFASFFMAERGILAKKLIHALGTEGAGERALELLRRINERIGGYLFVKTVVNVILGAISYVIMLLLGIEFALFWAVLIAFLNYVPYIGSLVGVAFPVLLSLAQFGTLSMAGVVMVTLGAAQIFVGGVLEPRMMGRAFNLSPFMVLLALLFWSTLWGLPGAVLAVPMTTSLVLVLAEIKSTRPLAIMLSASGRV